MKKEKSCGAVIYKVEKKEIFYLLSLMTSGHISLTKGHVEGDETEEETAQREIYEETGLKPIIDTRFREIITYKPAKKCIKDVIFFVAESFENITPVDLHDFEVKELIWVNFYNAFKMLTYGKDKKILKKANKYIRSKIDGKF